MDAAEKISSFVNKIPLWKRRLQSDNNLANFPIIENGLSKKNNIFGIILV